MQEEDDSETVVASSEGSCEHDDEDDEGRDSGKAETDAPPPEPAWPWSVLREPSKRVFIDLEGRPVAVIHRIGDRFSLKATCKVPTHPRNCVCWVSFIGTRCQ